MKITKRDYAQPPQNILIWVMPLFTYMLCKSGGLEYNELEWIWWVAIPTLFILWICINWKLTNKTK